MSDTPTTFEAKLARIEAIVKELEQGNATLEKQLGLYREGKALESECNAMLKGAEQEFERASGQVASSDEWSPDDLPR